jgi:hypothetical protein
MLDRAKPLAVAPEQPAQEAAQAPRRRPTRR